MLFQDLPLDIYTVICSFLDGLDILSLGETCRALHMATQDRSVWIDAFETAVSENMISSLTYPCHQELDLDALKDAATGPARMLAKLRKGQSSNTPATNPPSLGFTHRRVIGGSVTRLQMSYEDEDDADFEIAHEFAFSRICLIPGGRYLVAFSGARVLLYDLGTGYIPQSEIQCPIETEYGDNWLFMPSPSTNGKEFRLTVSQTTSRFGELVAEACVLRFIQDTADSPLRVDRRTTTLEVSQASDPEFFTVVHDLLIYTYARPHNGTPSCIINVWNFMEDTFASWSIPKETHLELFYDDGHVVMVEHNFLRGWKIPILCRREALQPIPIQDVPPAFVLPLPSGFDLTAAAESILPTECERIYDWYNTFKPLDFFQLKEEHPQSFAWSTYTVQTPLHESSSEPSHVQDKLVVRHPALTTFPRPLGGRNIVSNPHLICKDSVVRVFTRDGFPFVAMGSPWDAAASEIMVELQVPDEAPLPPRLSSRVNFAFDPFSGRFVYTSVDTYSIIILDYLGHPGVSPEVYEPFNNDFEVVGDQVEQLLNDFSNLTV